MITNRRSQEKFNSKNGVNRPPLYDLSVYCGGLSWRKLNMAKSIGGLRYYFTCQNCKNQSWYDERYCNNGYFYYTSKIGVKTEKVYCKNYEVTTK